MNGGADLGGMQGFGPVVEEANEPNFHAQWEERVMSMVVALGACGQWNIDQSRHARETLPPADYMRYSYYHIWLEGVQKLLLSRGMITAEELESGKLISPPVPVKGVMEAGTVWDKLHSLAGSAERNLDAPAKYAVGDTVRAKNIHPVNHTRLPRYARGKTGTITKVIGAHVFPDSAGNDKGDDPQWLYQVTFTARELWGEQGNSLDTVSVDLWEPHLESA